MAMPPCESHYDLFVIGSGPAGQKGAIAAAKLGKRVGIADGKLRLGGSCLHLGTIPSKTLREAVLYLSGYRQKEFYGESYAVKHRVTIRDLTVRVDAVLNRELQTIRDQLQRNDIEAIDGHARFVDAHTLEVTSDAHCTRVSADRILIACGTHPAHCPEVPLDGVRIFDSDQLLTAHRDGDREIAQSVIVVGAGVIGLEYASMLAALGTEVTIVDARPTLLDFADKEIVDALSYHLRSRGAVLRLGETVESVGIDARDRVAAMLASGKSVHGDSLLYTVGRVANTAEMGLETIGLATDSRGRIPVDETFRTSIPHVYAAGDVIGFPALASTSMEQGRLAACHMFGEPTRNVPVLHPYGIYTIPEISMVGQSEQELTATKVAYEVGIARFEELARGNMIGDRTGVLKILFAPEGHRVLGVHIIGDGATELIHIGQTAMALGGTLEFFRDTVFNYPTLAEGYKVAAFDGLNRL